MKQWRVLGVFRLVLVIFWNEIAAATHDRGALERVGRTLAHVGTTLSRAERALSCDRRTRTRAKGAATCIKLTVLHAKMAMAHPKVATGRWSGVMARVTSEASECALSDIPKRHYLSVKINFIKMKYLLLFTAFLFFSCEETEEEPNNGSEPKQVYIYAVTATPTVDESISIKNNSGGTEDLSGWTLGDSNDPTAYNIPNSTTLDNGQTKTFSHTTLGFQINDSKEIIYLKDASGKTIDNWTN